MIKENQKLIIAMNWMYSNTKTISRKICFCYFESPSLKKEIFLAFENFVKKKIRFQKNSVRLTFGCLASQKINPDDIFGT